MEETKPISLSSDSIDNNQVTDSISCRLLSQQTDLDFNIEFYKEIREEIITTTMNEGSSTQKLVFQTADTSDVISYPVEPKHSVDNVLSNPVCHQIDVESKHSDKMEQDDSKQQLVSQKDYPFDRKFVLYPMSHQFLYEEKHLDPEVKHPDIKVELKGDGIKKDGFSQSGTDKIQCLLCEEKYDNTTEYTHHLNMHLKDNEESKEKVTKELEIWKNEHGVQEDLNFGNKSESHFSLTNYVQECRNKIEVGRKQKPFSCTLCDKSFGMKFILNQHFQMFHPGKSDVGPFRCKLCNLSFSRKGNLNDHIDAVHRKLKNFPCALCDKSFARKFNLNLHVKTHHQGVSKTPNKSHTQGKNDAGGEGSLLSCTLCNKSFSSKKCLDRHVNGVHNKLKPFTCALCDKSFSQKGSLTLHIDSVHKKLKPFVCTLCDQSFAEKQTLTRHLDFVHHKIKKPFSCTLCEKSFTLNQHLQDHIDFIHNKLKNFSCTLCDKSFVRRTSLNRHINEVHNKFVSEDTLTIRVKAEHDRPVDDIHPKTELFTCTMCNRSFTEKRNLDIHVDEIHKKVKPFSCTLCEKSFNQKSNLTTHLDTVHYKLKSFPCTLCEKSFTAKGTLSQHVNNVHHKQKPFSCTLCEKSFHNKSQLAHHVDGVHNKLFTCPLCNKSFSRKQNLNAHMKSKVRPCISTYPQSLPMK